MADPLLQVRALDATRVGHHVGELTAPLMAALDEALRLKIADRLEKSAFGPEALAGGLIDERQGEGVTLIEWAERLEDAMPAGRLDVLIEGAGDDPRRIVLRAGDAGYTRYLEALPANWVAPTAEPATERAPEGSGR